MPARNLREKAEWAVIGAGTVGLIALTVHVWPNGAGGPGSPPVPPGGPQGVSVPFPTARPMGNQNPQISRQQPIGPDPCGSGTRATGGYPGGGSGYPAKEPPPVLTSLAVVGQYAVVAGGTEIFSIDLGDLAKVSVVDTTTAHVRVDRLLAVAGGVAALEPDGVEIFTVDDEGSLQSTAFVNGDFDSAAADGDRIALRGPSEVRVLTLAAGAVAGEQAYPAAQFVSPMEPRANEPSTVGIWGHTLAVGGSILDMDDPTAVAASMPWDTYAAGTMVAAGDLMLMRSGGTLTLADVRQSGAPRVLSSTAIGLDLKDHAALGRYVYVATAAEALVPVDVTDPTFPKVLAPACLGASVEAVAAAGRVVLAITADGRLVGLGEAPDSLYTAATRNGENLWWWGEMKVEINVLTGAPVEPYQGEDSQRAAILETPQPSPDLPEILAIPAPTSLGQELDYVVKSTTGGRADAVAANPSEPFAYLLVGNEVHTYDVTDPPKPRLIGKQAVGGHAEAALLATDDALYAVLSDADHDSWTYDGGDFPSRVVRWPYGESGQLQDADEAAIVGLAVDATSHEGVLYVATWTSSGGAISVIDGETLVVRDHIPLPGESGARVLPTALLVEGGFLLVAGLRAEEDGGTMLAYDLSRPDKPTEVPIQGDHIEFWGFPALTRIGSEVAAHAAGGYTFVAVDDSGVRVTRSFSLEELASDMESVPGPDGEELYWNMLEGMESTAALDLDGRWAHLAAGYAAVIDLDPSGAVRARDLYPVEGWWFGDDHGNRFDAQHSLATARGVTYASGADGLTVLSLVNGRLGVLGRGSEAGALACVQPMNEGVLATQGSRLVHVSADGLVRELAKAESNASPCAIGTFGSDEYVVAQRSFLAVWSDGNDLPPRPSGDTGLGPDGRSLPFDRRNTVVDTEGLVLSVRRNSVVLLRAAGEMVVEIGQFDLPSEGTGVGLADSLAMVSTRTGGIALGVIRPESDPENTDRVSFLRTLILELPARGVAARGPNAWVLAGESARNWTAGTNLLLVELDLTDPANPRALRSIALTDPNHQRVVASEEGLVVAWGGGPIEVVDTAADPPRRVTIPTQATEVLIRGREVTIVTQNGALVVYDVGE